MSIRIARCLLLAVLLVPCGSLLGKDSQQDRDLSTMSLEELLNTTVVTAARHVQKNIDSPRFISVITAEDILQKNYRTVPEALNEMVGVLVQETNYGGGSPIIRGMVGNQILILIDGIRMNNAIYRLGPNQYLNTIDMNQVERIEVIHGTGSVLYGSDAFGGVINIITKSRAGSTTGSSMEARAFGRFASADRSGVGRFEVSGNVGKLGLIGGVSLKNFGNLRAGNGTGLQNETGYLEGDGDLKLSYGLSDRQSLVLGLQRVDQKDVPRTDVVNSGQYLKYEWDPERRDLASLQYEFKNIGSFVNSLMVGVSYQDQLEEGKRIVGSAPSVQRLMHDEAQSKGVVVQLSSLLGERQVLTYGLDYYGDRIISRRVDVDSITGQQSAKAGTFADGSTSRSVASFLQDEIRVSGSLSANLGVRYSQFHLKAAVTDPGIGAIEINSSPSAVTASARGLYKFNPNLGLFFGVGQGFRAPNVDDSTILGSFAGGFEIPNPNLQPEKSRNYEFGIKTQGKRFSGTAAYFMSDFDSLIQRQPETFQGRPFLDLNKNGVQDKGEANIFQRQNGGQALIQGIEIDTRVQLLQDWSLSADVAWIRGKDEITHNPLNRIPPIKGTFAVKWAPVKNFWIEYYNLVASRQDRLGLGDLADPRIPAGGSPGFAVFNIRSGWNWNRQGSVTIALENLTNKRYRFHGSGIDAPGTNLVIGYQKAF